MAKIFNLVIPAMAAIVVLAGSCSKDAAEPADPCSGINIVVTGAANATSGPSANDGSISASASGASSITFSLNGGTFQSSGNFNALAAGTYTVVAKSAAGCTGSATFTVPAGDACSGKSIVITPGVQGSDKCAGTGSVTVTASGSSGFTYKLDASGAYQASNVFSSVTAGSHIVYVKDAAGCERSTSISVPELPLGAQFSGVATLLRSRCAPCHTSQSEGGANYTSDCNIVSLKERIKARAVDAGDMPQGGPQLSAAEKKIITDWIAGGGKTSH